MKRVFRYYFSHYTIWIYIAFAVLLLYFSVSYGYLKTYWFALFFPLIIAPFFEWVVHKYVLHMQIGNRKWISLEEPINKGDWVKIHFGEKEKLAEVLQIEGNKMEVGYGWARKMKFLHDHMELLHYGHHKDPNYISLIFAPLLSVVILFCVLFSITFLITFSLGFATVFLLGSVIYYLYYEWMHLGHHIPGYKHIFSWNNRLKRAHQLHHFRNENYWWGITSSFGDICLGTYKSHEEVKVSNSLRNINSK